MGAPYSAIILICILLWIVNGWSNRTWGIVRGQEGIAAKGRIIDVKGRTIAAMTGFEINRLTGLADAVKFLHICHFHVFAVHPDQSVFVEFL